MAQFGLECQCLRSSVVEHGPDKAGVRGSFPRGGTKIYNRKKGNIMPWIQNISLSQIIRGHHFDPGVNSMLIQIVDPGVEFPEPKYAFKERHQFFFLDIEANDNSIDESWRCSPEQAKRLVQCLQHALDNSMNVVVHCHAGVCRSGAVVEVGVMMGLHDTGEFRSPNLLVKHLMMESLGLSYDPKEKHSINGVALAADWTNDNEKVFILADARKAKRQQDSGLD